MTREEAIKILSKDTSMETVNGLIYYAGFNKEKVVEKIQEAMAMGSEALKKQIPKKIVKVKIPNTSFCKAGTIYKCPSCGEKLYADWKFCFECGQALDWTEEGET